MILYASRTGNVRYIVNQLGIDNLEIEDGLVVSDPFFIFTYTDGLGDVPKKVAAFMKDNHKLCRGIIASGNTNFGVNVFCGSADKLSEMYNLPIIHKLELRGFSKDYDHIREVHNTMIREGNF